MKLISLSGKYGEGKFAKIDDEDDDKVNKYTWWLDKNGYVVTDQWLGKGKSKRLYMHRLIMNARKNQEVDHHHGIRTDNRKSELRLCNNHQNARNTRKRDNCSSIYKGVLWDKQTNRWIARLCPQGKQIYLT